MLIPASFKNPPFDTNLTELIFNQDNLLARKYFLDQLLDQRGLSGSEESGKNVYLCHVSSLFLFYNDAAHRRLTSDNHSSASLADNQIPNCKQRQAPDSLTQPVLS